MDTRSDFPILELLSPAAFAHPVTRLEFIETHISWVILTGPFAYKIKKSVKLDFIDTSSLERRRQCCEEEVRLNRRLAADMYLGVAAVLTTPAGLRVVDPGAKEPSDVEHCIIEYAVCMRQFAPVDELTALLDSGAVAPSEIHALGEHLADFHRSAPTASPLGDGYAKRMRRAVLDNLDSLYASSLWDPDPRLYGLATWSRAELERLGVELHEREHSGHVRECHGDLHARNIVRWQGTLTAFDCIEFNANLRWIDTMDDVAFLYMDLIHRARSDLAAILLNRYLEITGDYSGVALLPFHSVHRALVRARVNSISERQQPDKTSHYSNRFHARMGTAQACMRRTPQTLIVTHGVSGSGKSWLSERLIPQLNAIRIRSDLERKRLAGAAAASSQESEPKQDIYLPEFTARTYDHLLRCAAQCLDGGCNVIVDAAFLEASQRRQLQALARNRNVSYVIVSCTASRQKLIERVRMRQQQHLDPSDADVVVLTRQLEEWKPLEQDELAVAVVVNTEQTDVIEGACAAIRRSWRADLGADGELHRSA